MAKKKTTTTGGGFYRIGRALGASAAAETTSGYVDIKPAMKNITDTATILANKRAKNEANYNNFMSDNPVPGLTAENRAFALKVFDGEIQPWLNARTDEYNKAAAIVSNQNVDVSSKQYQDAVDKMNSVKAAFTSLDQQIMQISADQSKYHGQNWKAGGSNSDEQNQNIQNIVQGNFKLDDDGNGLNLSIGEDGLLYSKQDVNAYEDGKYIVSRKVPYSDLSFGSQYTGVLSNLVNQEMKEVGVNAETHKARGKNEFIESKARLDVEEHVESVLGNDPNAVINEFYQGKNPMIDMYIAQEKGIEYGSDEWYEFSTGRKKSPSFTTWSLSPSNKGKSFSDYKKEYGSFGARTGKGNKEYMENFQLYKSPEFAEQLKEYYIDMQTQNLKNHYNNLNPMAETTATTTTDNLG
tara:strand:+ start:3399 stop:4625 length:1227 start_codon:yes stop_codon:yes gene_type:complete